MPYYVHSSVCSPESGWIFEDAKSAHEDKANHTPTVGKMVVTFVATDDEKENWRTREFRRTHHNAYGRVTETAEYRVLPWSNEDWQIELDKLHYAYLSVIKPGLVAYTPSEEWGCQDRQLCVRPGKYLQQFAPHLTKAQVDHYCAMIKAIDDTNVIKWARSADDIERVYRHGASHGDLESSCMRYDAHKFAGDGVHPVRVYGDSDLALAYLENLQGECIARSIVWPDKKYYYRVYSAGSNTLSVMLQHEGYTQHRLDGARVQAIPCDGDDDVYVMPYIDGCSVADLSRDRKRFTLGNGSYSTDNTNGVTDINYNAEPDYICSHCGGNEVDEEGDLCQSCEDKQHTCEHCENSFFDDSPYGIDDYGIVCRRCYRDLILHCDECRSVYFRESFSDDDNRRRSRNDLEDYCTDCEDTIIERRAAESQDTDTPIVATDDTETLPLSLTAETETVF